MKSALLAATAVLLLATGSASAANLVTNGSFAGGTSTGWAAAPSNFTGYPYNFATTNCAAEPSCAVLNDDAGVLVSMWQPIAGLTVGDSYVLTWDMASYFACCGSTVTPGAGAGIDGHSWLYAIGNATTFEPYSETFTYAGGSDVLTFYSQANGTDTDAAFTNISLTGASAPEPAAWALMLGGFGLMGGALRRRTTAALTAR